MEHPDYKAIVIGGGFFGCSLALHLRRFIDKILILEKEGGIFQRASYANQARVHNGYHYPRNLLTALRSRANFTRFIDEYRDCIDDTFEHFYAVSRNSSLSKTTATQFRRFSEHIGAPIVTAPKEIKKLFDASLIEDVFLVGECAFDAVKLRRRVAKDLADDKVEVRTNSEVVKISIADGSKIQVFFNDGNGTDCHTAEYVFNCTYSQINRILSAAALPAVPLKHELAEIALVEVPSHLKNLAFTVMDGPFFSTMPFPPEGLHSFSHVRYTPHCSWEDPGGIPLDPHELRKENRLRTNFPYMIKDAQRYMPSLRDCRHVASIWEVKAVLPRSETDDSRPILFIKSQELRNFVSVFGGKIDNIYDVLHEIDDLFA